MWRVTSLSMWNSKQREETQTLRYVRVKSYFYFIVMISGHCRHSEQGNKNSCHVQKHLATMLFWGQHGVSKDTVSAAKWFERSAMQMKDPSAMYDYSILLMKVLWDMRTQPVSQWNWTLDILCVRSYVLTLIDSLIDVDFLRARE